MILNDFFNLYKILNDNIYGGPEEVYDLNESFARLVYHVLGVHLFIGCKAFFFRTHLNKLNINSLSQNL